MIESNPGACTFEDVKGLQFIGVLPSLCEPNLLLVFRTSTGQRKCVEVFASTEQYEGGPEINVAENALVRLAFYDKWGLEKLVLGSAVDIEDFVQRERNIIEAQRAKGRESYERAEYERLRKKFEKEGE